MNIALEAKEKIDSMSYEQLLYLWRTAPVGDPLFKGQTGMYFSKRMAELRNNGADHVQASKDIGW